MAGHTSRRTAAAGTARIRYIWTGRRIGPGCCRGVRKSRRRVDRRQPGLAREPLRRPELPHRARQHPDCCAANWLARQSGSASGPCRRLVVRHCRWARPFLRHPADRGPRHLRAPRVHQPRWAGAGQHYASIRRFSRRHLERWPNSRTRGAHAVGPHLGALSDVLRCRRLATF